MRTTTTITALTMALALTGCGSRPNTRLDPDAAATRRYEWRGSLVTPASLAGAMQVRGTATWTRRGDYGSMVTLDLSNATSGGLHPWHIHRGRCGDNGPIVGDPSAYPSLSVNNDGNARATANLDPALPASGEFYVNVHALATNMGTIISCGNLAAPVTTGDSRTP